MIISNGLYGQTSNNYFQFIHLHAYCKANNIKFIAPLFEYKYSNKFPNFKKSHKILIQLIFLNKITTSIFNRIIDKFNFKLDTEEKANYFKENFKNNKVHIISGWYFRSDEDIIKYRIMYQKMFLPKKEIIDKKSIYFNIFENKITLGIHIRRGDYKDFMNGIYYFDDCVFVAYIDQLIKLLNQKINIIIFSNEKIQMANFSKYENIKISKEDTDTDHFIMSQCDYLIGPPSTFTMWASYIGKAKYFHIEDENSILTLDKFITY